jgi:hypothetical protein
MYERATDYRHQATTVEHGPMKKLILAAACVLAATSAAAAQAGFNPGTVVSNVYETLAVYGCGSGFGFSPVGCNYSRSAPVYDREWDGSRRRLEKGAANGTSAGSLR